MTVVHTVGVIIQKTVHVLTSVNVERDGLQDDVR